MTALGVMRLSAAVSGLVAAAGYQAPEAVHNVAINIRALQKDDDGCPLESIAEATERINDHCCYSPDGKHLDCTHGPPITCTAVVRARYFMMITAMNGVAPACQLTSACCAISALCTSYHTGATAKAK